MAIKDNLLFWYDLDDEGTWSEKHGEVGAPGALTEVVDLGDGVMTATLDGHTVGRFRVATEQGYLLHAGHPSMHIIDETRMFICTFSVHVINSWDHLMGVWGAGGTSQWQVGHDDSNRIHFTVRNSTDTASVAATATTFGNIRDTPCGYPGGDVNDTYMIAVWHDPVANEIGISLWSDSCTDKRDTAAISGGTPSYNTNFTIGQNNLSGADWNGYIGKVGGWSRILTVDELTTLWNSGAPLNYSELPAPAVSMWGLGYEWF